MTETPLRDPDLSHIRGPSPLPPLRQSLQFLHDSYGFVRRNTERYGEVHRVSTFGRRRVMLHGADALELVLTDRERIFSSEGGWEVLHRLFPGGLMLRDFDEHRAHRRVMQAAFKAPVMRAYLDRLGAETERLLAGWPTGRAFAFHPAAKELTLGVGCAVFMGLPPDHPEARRMSRALAAEVAGALGVVRRPLPLTRMGRGVRGRRDLTAGFRALIAERREAPGEDFFSQMCAARDEEGRGWTDEEIVDHFNFLMMAAHDTTASTLSAMAWALGAHPEWQERALAEARAIPGPVDEAALAGMEVTDRVMREALRMVAPVPFIPRRAVREFEWRGARVPAGAIVVVSPGLVMMSEEHWTEPERFDPDRFSSNRAEDRSHRYAWAPFGGGAHKCIGMHFAAMQVKLFFAALLRRRRIELVRGAPVRWRRVPIPRPAGGLPVRLVPIG